jgi:hypothetical protein
VIAAQVADLAPAKVERDRAEAVRLDIHAVPTQKPHLDALSGTVSAHVVACLEK